MNQLKANVRRRRPVIPRNMSTMFILDRGFVGSSVGIVAGASGDLGAGTRRRAEFSAMVGFLVGSCRRIMEESENWIIVHYHLSVHDIYKSTY
jgi:hypothetical protein